MRASTPMSGTPTVVRRSASSSSDAPAASVDLISPFEATGEVSVMPQAWRMGRPICSR